MLTDARSATAAPMPADALSPGRPTDPSRRTAARGVAYGALLLALLLMACSDDSESGPSITTAVGGSIGSGGQAGSGGGVAGSGPGGGSSVELRAFPGAEGMGADAIGGRGGTVYIVDTLSDDPADGQTLREACEASGPRIVVFEVSGIIDLATTLTIDDPFLTIAGQSSPGGILVAGQPTRVLTHEVIITHMRFRKGSHGCSGATCETEGETLYVGNGYNVIVDHCSFSWGTDEVVQVGSYWGDAYDVTFSWCTIHEGLNDPHPESNHGYGFLISNKFYTDAAPQVSIHHCYLAHHRDRTPEITGSAFVDFRNNVAYDWQGALSPRTQYADGEMSRVNWVHNYSQPGVNSNPCYPASNAGELNHGGTGSQAGVGSESAEATLYVEGNLGCIRDDPSDDEWCVMSGWTGELLSTDWQRPTPHEPPGVPVTTTTMSRDYALEILETVGATKPARDGVDERVVSEFSAGTGDQRGNVSYPADFPTFPQVTPPADLDRDGMADEWEASRGLDSNVDDSALDDDDDGYTNIEEYLHQL